MSSVIYDRSMGKYTEFCDIWQVDVEIYSEFCDIWQVEGKCAVSSVLCDRSWRKMQ